MTYTTYIMGGVLLGVLLLNSLGADSKTAVIISGAAAIGSMELFIHPIVKWAYVKELERQQKRKKETMSFY